MARIAIATLQPVFDCRWSRHDDAPGGTDTQGPAWVCVREGVRRRLQADECETCPHWELDIRPHAAAAPIAATAPPATVHTHGMALLVLTWVFVILSAGTLLALGVAALTSLLMLPVTVGLWLMAAAVLGFAWSGRLPDA